MTEQEAKAVKWLENAKNNAVINLCDIEAVAQILISALEEIQQYRALGTTEELREAREKQVPKKAVFVHPIQLNDGGDYMCPACKTGTILNAYGGKSKYCPWCGQAIDWS